MSDDMSDLLTPAQAAELTTLSASHLRKLAREGAIPSHRLGPKLLRFRRKDIEQWLASQLTANG